MGGDINSEEEPTYSKIPCVLPPFLVLLYFFLNTRVMNGYAVMTPITLV